MKLRWSLALVLAAAGCLLQPSFALAGDKKPPEKKDEPAKDVVVNGELTNADLKDKVRTGSYCKMYTYKMTQGHNYQIDMKAGFDSYLRLENAKGEQVAFDDDSGGFPHARIIYRAPKTEDFSIICTTFGGGATGKFTLTVKDLDAKNPPPKKDGGPNGKPEPKKGCDAADQDEAQPDKQDAKTIDLKPGKDKFTEFKGELTDNDPRYKGEKISKIFAFAMEAGKTYRIDHSSKAFDAYLILENPAGKIVEQNDDNGDSLDSRIVYKAQKAGVYRIVATSLRGRDTGAFMLSVRPATDAEVKYATLLEVVKGLFNANADEKKQTVKDVANYLESKGKVIDKSDVQLAMIVSRSLEFARDEKAAAQACVQYAKLIAKAEDAKVAEAARVLEGAGRRLTLPGNEMMVKGKLLDGKDFDLKKLKGKVVLVDFWATWCGPCVGEIPHIKKMHAQYNKQGFEVVGISLDDSPETAKKFIAKEELPWGCIFDGIGKEGAGLADHYGVMSIPLAILVDRDGRVVSMNARGAELTRLLEARFEKK